MLLVVEAVSSSSLWGSASIRGVEAGVIGGVMGGVITSGEATLSTVVEP